MIRLLALIASPAALAFAVAPALSQTSGTVRACSISGWSIDPDPAGLNVRAGPSPTARIVGRLPAPEMIEGERRFVGFDVLESRNGWFRIANAVRWSGDYGRPSTLPAGWISGRYLDFAVQSDIAFALPDPTSPVVARAWQDARGFQPLATRHPVECRGEWVRLSVAGRDRRERQGWVRGICGIQETTCDGVRGDFLPGR